jgi:hypothetical protein
MRSFSEFRCHSWGESLEPRLSLSVVVASPRLSDPTVPRPPATPPYEPPPMPEPDPGPFPGADPPVGFPPPPVGGPAGPG